MTTFPIVLIPNVIRNAKTAKPIVPAFTAIAPSKPSSPPQPLDIKALTTYATIGLFVSVAFVFINPALGITSGLLSFAAIAYAAWTMRQSFPQRKREHDNYVRDFPKSCCKAIAQIIAEVIGDDLELRQFIGIEDLPTRKQWTEAEAAQMAADNYRQTYLAETNASI